jgi:hypothetical protein
VHGESRSVSRFLKVCEVGDGEEGVLCKVGGLWEGESGNYGMAYHLFITLPLKFPQFWHCTVMFSAPERGDVKARLSMVLATLVLSGGCAVCRASALWVVHG